MSFERTRYDPCAHAELIERSGAPGNYRLHAPDVPPACGGAVVGDERARLQAYGRPLCGQGATIDAESALRNIDRPLSSCATDGRVPDDFPGVVALAEGCGYAVSEEAGPRPAGRECFVPAEDTRLSNPPSTLRATGWNRWHPTCRDPTESSARARMEPSVGMMVSSQTVIKDNHVACDINPFLDDSPLLPPRGPDVDAFRPADGLGVWSLDQAPVPEAWKHDLDLVQSVPAGVTTDDVLGIVRNGDPVRDAEGRFH